MSDIPEIDLGLLRMGTKLKKPQKQVIKTRGLQTDRKLKQNIHSPLMLILLVKKKLRKRLEESFFKMYLYKNKNNHQRFILKFVSMIMKFKIKINKNLGFHKLINYNKKFKNICKNAYSLKNWVKHKILARKVEVFNKFKILTKNLSLQQNENLESTSRVSKIGSSQKKPDKTQPKNRLMESGSKSLSTSKVSSVKSPVIDKQLQITLQQGQKLKKQNQQFKLMQLSQDVRETLKKIQRFDRVFYAQETEKICKDILTNELKRLEKIKNSQKQMRAQFYDNQLTITALYNHIKLVHEMNRQLADLNKYKEIHDREETKRKEEQFKANLQNRRKSRTANIQTQIKQIVQNIEVSLSKRQYQKARQQINMALNKYQKQQLMKDKIIFYKALLQTITNGRDLQRCIEDINKQVNLLKNLDINQPQTSIKLMKQSQREYTQVISKYSKLQRNFEKQTLIIIQNLQIFNNTVIQHLSSIIVKTDKNIEDEYKKLQKDIDRYKTQMEQLTNIKIQYDQMIKIRKQFQKKVSVIVQKAENKIDYKRDFDNLHKDKLFIQEKPFSDFFTLQNLSSSNYEISLQKELQNISVFMDQVTSIYNKEKLKSQGRTRELTKLIDNASKKTTNMVEIVSGVTSLIYSVVHKTEEEWEERNKRIRTVNDGEFGDGGNKGRRLSEESSNSRRISRSREKDEAGKLEDKGKQLPSELERAEKKMSEIIEKIIRNEDWLSSLETLKKDRTYIQNKPLQLVLNFYSQISQKLKNINTMPVRMEKFLTQLMKINQSVNLPSNNKITEIQKIFENSVVTDPSLEQNFKILIEYTKNMYNTFDEFNQIHDNTQKQVYESKIKQLTSEHKNVMEILESQKNKSKNFQEKMKNGQKVNREQSQKIALLDKQINSLKQWKLDEIERAHSQSKKQEVIKQQISKQFSNNILQFVSWIQSQVSTKQFMNNHQLRVDQSKISIDNSIQKGVVQAIKKVTEIGTNRLEEERKQNSKTIKSYEKELQKMNTLLSQFQIQLKQKDHQYDQLLSTFTEYKRQVGSQTRKPSHKTPGKSPRSNSSGKRQQMKNMKASMQVFAQEERKMLEKLNQAQNQKIHLREQMENLENQVFKGQMEIKKLQQNISKLENMVEQQRNNYGKEYNNWKQKQQINAKQLSEIKMAIETQFIEKENGLINKFDVLSKQKELFLQEYYQNFVKIQNELQEEINHLREELRSKNNQMATMEELRNTKIVNSELEASCAALKAKVEQYEVNVAQRVQGSIQLQNLVKENAQLQEEISRLCNKTKQYQQELTKRKTLSQSRIIQLSQVFLKTHQNQDQMMSPQQVNKILKEQEENFKKYLTKHDDEIEHYFQNEVFPQKIKQVEMEIRKNYVCSQQTDTQIVQNGVQRNVVIGSDKIEKCLNEQIINLRQNNRIMKQQYQNQYRIAVEKQNSLQQKQEVLARLQIKFEQQMNKYQDFVSVVEKNNKKNLEIQHNIRNYLHVLQISYDEASTGIVSENVAKLYVEGKIQPMEKVIKEVIVSDPSQTITINNLKAQLDDQLKIIKNLENKIKTEQMENVRLMQASQASSSSTSIIESAEYKILQDNLKRVEQILDDLNKKYAEQVNNNHILSLQLHSKKSTQDTLKHQLRKMQSSWKTKHYEQGRDYQKKIIQLNNDHVRQNSQLKPLQQYKLLETRYEQLKIRYNSQVNIKTELQNKLNQKVKVLEVKIDEMMKHYQMEIAKLNKDIMEKKDRCDELVNQFNEKDQNIRMMEERFNQEMKGCELLFGQKLEEKDNYYENFIDELTKNFERNRLNYQIAVSHFNHKTCEYQYINLQQKSSKQISDLKQKLNQMTRIKSEQIQLLKQIIDNNQKQFQHLGNMIEQYRQTKQQLKHQKEVKITELKNTVLEKQQDIERTKLELSSVISTIRIEKEILENKLKQSIQKNNGWKEKQVDQSHLKIVQLEALINNKTMEISNLEQLNQKRKKNLEEEYFKFTVIETEKESYRIKCNNLENQVKRLESEITHMNNELQNNKKSLLESETRQESLKNQIMKSKIDGNGVVQKVDVYKWKNQLIRENSQPIKQRIKQVLDNKNDSLSKIQKMIDQLQSLRRNEKHEYDVNELQVLKKINQQVTQLVSTNRQLQTKCALLESQIDGGDRQTDNTLFVVEFQDKMGMLVNFLLDKLLIDSLEMYSKFIHTSKEYLNTHNIEEYFNSWLNFMKSLFLNVNENRADELRQKAQQLIDLKEQMHQILDRHIQCAEDKSYDSLATYKMIFSDIKILLKEYMNSGNQEYIQMVWRSLQD